MSVSKTLTMMAGRPFTQRIRIPNAKNVWPTLDALQVQSQLRTGESSKTALIADLHAYMTWSFDGNDLVIDWVMTGAQTRAVYAKKWGTFKTGFFNIVVADAGTTMSRALVTPVMGMEAHDTPTVAGGGT